MTQSPTSLLEGLNPAEPRVAKPPRHFWPAPLRSLGARAASAWERAGSDPKGRTTRNRVVGTLTLVLSLGGSLGLYFWLRPMPQPDYAEDDVANVFEYTLLTDEFNKLPIRKRLELIGQLVQRLKGLSGSEAALMAAFAAGIEGEARRQIEENVSRLAMDAWDEKAKEYASVPPGEREDYLKKAYIDFQKMLEAAGGRVRDISDEKRLEQGYREANRGKEQMADPNRRPDTQEMGEMMVMMDRLSRNNGPAERARGAQMLRDMSRMFRGEDLGKGG